MNKDELKGLYFKLAGEVAKDTHTHTGRDHGAARFVLRKWLDGLGDIRQSLVKSVRKTFLKGHGDILKLLNCGVPKCKYCKRFIATSHAGKKTHDKYRKLLWSSKHK